MHVILKINLNEFHLGGGASCDPWYWSLASCWSLHRSAASGDILRSPSSSTSPMSLILASCSLSLLLMLTLAQGLSRLSCYTSPGSATIFKKQYSARQCFDIFLVTLALPSPRGNIHSWTFSHADCLTIFRKSNRPVLRFYRATISQSSLHWHQNNVRIKFSKFSFWPNFPNQPSSRSRSCLFCFTLALWKRKLSIVSVSSDFDNWGNIGDWHPGVAIYHFPN